MHDIRRKRWSDVLDQAAADVAHYERMRSTAMLSQIKPYTDALAKVRTELGRRRRDYFTKDDAARVTAVAYPELPV